MAAARASPIAASAFFESAPWLDYDQRAADIRSAFEKDYPVSDQLRELVRYATLAPNGHNTQPWKFAIQENAVEIHPDHARRLPVVDPDDRELWISLGCALENLLVAARATGYAAEVTYPDSLHYIRVRLAADTPQGSPLFDAIPVRQSTRSAYDGNTIPRDQLDRIQALPLEPGVSLRLVMNRLELETVLEYVNQGNLRQFADKAFLNELIHWLRFTNKEALASMDGLFMRCMGNPEVPRWLGRMVVARIRPRAQANADARKLRSSSGAIVVASGSDDTTAWVRTGQVFERIALQMTALNIKVAFLNQPLEIADIRRQFQSAIGLGDALPQLLFRTGYADPMPRSVRRTVEQVLL